MTIDSMISAMGRHHDTSGAGLIELSMARNLSYECQDDAARFIGINPHEDIGSRIRDTSSAHFFDLGLIPTAFVVKLRSRWSLTTLLLVSVPVSWPSC